MQKMILTITILLSLNLKAYDFPVDNSYQSTLISVFSNYFIPGKPKYYNYNQEFYTNRRETPFFRKRNFVSFRYYPNRTNSPLTILLSGLGGTPSSGTSEFYAKLLLRQGHQVISIGNQFNWRFNLSVSKSAVPGYIPRDAEDLHFYLKKIFAYLAIKPEQFSKINLAGYSLGALNAAFLASLDEEKAYFNFDNLVMVNPPISVFSSGSRLDEMYNSFKNQSLLYKKKLSHKMSKLAFQYINNPPNQLELINILTHFPFSPSESEAMIGKTFRESLAESILISELVNRKSYIKLHLNTPSPQASLAESRKIGFYPYFKKILLPNLKENYPNKTEIQVLEEMSLTSLFPYLSKRKGVQIFHNMDDIILNEGDIDLLQSELNEKVKIYPLGGHLGNIWFSENANDFLRAISN